MKKMFLLFFLVILFISQPVIAEDFPLSVQAGGMGFYKIQDDSVFDDLDFILVDPNQFDNVDFEYTADNKVITFKFPVWLNQSVGYNNVLGIIPKTDGILTLLEIQYAPGNILYMRAQILDILDPLNKCVQAIQPFPDYRTMEIPVIAGRQYNFSFRLITGNDDSLLEMITFEIKKR